jgi:hypothetical protein
VSLPQPQSVGQLAQFSPAKPAQIKSPHIGLHVPPWHVVPGPHVPHDPPQLSGPQVAPLQVGVQQLGGVPGLQTCPTAHGQSPGHELQFSLELGWQV